ncbi:MAG: glycyl radical protein [Candidatus Mcinerneyibacterium aminivorans]|uniref:Glycyl radical protein n=1 Tax=Candidatus Mcinerneyibacterium aminivorans TaxID=2703815 RepID=A0A5D0MEG2_9BACT|nr:MAG: glycyl radical protein [Candidatus Mcinerneyibacterium aminivorans]
MKRGMNKRIQKLREKSVSKEPELSIERGLLIKETYEKYEGKVETPILRALAFKNIMEKKEIHIDDLELIVGEKGERPQVAPVYPELTCYTEEDFDVLHNREEVSFKSSDVDRKKYLKEIAPFFEKRSMRSKIFEEMSDEWKKCYEAGIFTEFMEQRGPGHTVAGDKIYKKGFNQIIRDIDNKMLDLDMLNDDEAYEKKVQLEAMKITAEAIIALSKRYKKLAEKKAEKEKDEKRKKELETIAENCRVVPERAPTNFYQAIQMYWFVHIGVTLELNIWDSFSPGRLDQHLYPFYKEDLEYKNITREKAKELFENLWIKFNNQPAPPKVGVTMKESSTYTDFANINTGGIDKYGNNGVNDVSYLILEVMDEMKLVQPNSNVQISKKNPDKFLKEACKISRKGWGQPAFYNTEAIVQELLNAGKSLDDARQGGASGCVETGAFGKEAYILTGYFNLSKILEITINNGYDFNTNTYTGLQLKSSFEYRDFDELFENFRKNLRHFVDIKVRGNNIIEKLYSKHMPVPFMSTVIDDCVENGKDYNSGGARYNTNYIQGVGIGNVADSLAAIKYNVFDKNNFSMEKLLEATAENFEGYEEIYNLVKNRSPKYGNDNNYADKLMVKAFEAFYEEVTGRKNMKGGSYRINMLPTTCHIYFGSVTGATANGRLKGKPLPDGISPSKGADKKGPTAVLKSVAKMDHLKTGGTLLNQKFNKATIEGEDGLNKFAGLIRAFFKMDGHHVQFNVIDKETLLDAQKNPGEYENLVVRVAGYSDYFNNLSKNLQDEIIARTEQDI